MPAQPGFLRNSFIPISTRETRENEQSLDYLIDMIRWNIGKKKRQ